MKLTIHTKSFPGHRGRPGQQGGSLPMDESPDTGGNSGGGSLSIDDDEDDGDGPGDLGVNTWWDRKTAIVKKRNDYRPMIYFRAAPKAYEIIDNYSRDNRKADDTPADYKKWKELVFHPDKPGWLRASGESMDTIETLIGWERDNLWEGPTTLGRYNSLMAVQRKMEALFREAGI